MEEIIKELETRLSELIYAEQTDMYHFSVSIVQEGKPKPSHYPTKSQIRESISDHNAFLKNINKENDEFYKLCEREVQASNPERTEIISTLECFIRMLKEENLPAFVEFKQMRKIFKYIGLNPNSQLTIFGIIVKNNAMMNTGDNCHVYLPDTEAILNHHYEHITTEEVFNLLNDGSIEEFLRDKNPQNPLGQKEVLDCLSATLIDRTDCQKACLKIDEVLSKEAEDTTEEDFQILIENMEYLSFGDLAYRIIKKINRYKNSLNKGAPSDEEPENKESEHKEREIPVPLKQKNINQTLREINKYYNLDTKELKDLLSMNQIIYILSLMYSISMESSIIESFLRSAMREFKNLHPYAIYNQAYDKFVYLGQENLEIQEHLDMIEYILSETSIFICSKEKYIETKRLIEEEINAIMQIINGNYSYEIESAKNLIKSNKE